jgi:hypothetical protein
MNQKLTILQVFKAMQKFLEGYYQRTSSDDLGSLLGDMQLLNDESTMDPSAWEDWLIAIDEVFKKNHRRE